MYLIKKSCLCWVKYFSAIAKFLLCNHVNTYSNTYAGHSFFFINEYNFYVYDPTKQQSVNIWGGATLMSPWSEVVPELACLHFGAICFPSHRSLRLLTSLKYSSIATHWALGALQCLVPARYPTLSPPPPEKRTLMIMRWGFPKWWTGGVLTRPALVTQVPTVFWNLRNTMFLLFLALCGSEEQGSVESFHRPELLPGVTLAHVTLVHTYKMVNGFLSPCYSRLHPSIPNRHYSHNVFSSS